MAEKRKGVKQTPMIQQYLQIKSQVPDAILFFRMGDFYEMFFEDALEASGILDIALTSRNKGKGEDSVPLCGIPYHACDQYLARLIQAGKRVAICEQVEDPKAAKTIVRREIIRIVTPGLPVGLEAILGAENIFLGALYPADGGMGLAFLDILSGDLKLLSESRFEAILNHLQVHQPREILIPAASKESRPSIVSNLEKLTLVTPFDEASWDVTDRVEALIRDLADRGMIEEAALSETERETLRFLLAYLVRTKNDHLDHLKNLQVTARRPYLRLDAFTRRNLEIFEPLSGKTRRATLLAVLDETRTPMGRRLLKEWLRYPLQEVQAIDQRLEAVDGWRSDSRRRKRLQASLKGMADLERLMGRITADRANARDLVQLRETLKALPGIIGEVGEVPGALTARSWGDLDPMDDLVATLQEHLVDDPPVTVREGGMIREGVSEELDELREIRSSGKSWMIRLEAKEQARTGISSLKVRYNRVFGYYIEVTKANLHLVPDEYQRKQTLVNAERFVTPELKEMEEKVLSAEERIQQVEYSLFTALRDTVKSQARHIQAIAGALAQLDVLISLAEVAHRNRYCRPRFTDDTRLTILQGRHPVVERINLQESFVPNDTRLDCEENQIMLITGPNMAGKSTYIRQVALIALMAHVGSFVPAQKVEIGVIDQIFTRVGASDNLALGLSTFMVEMKEAASILANSTVRSLIVLDEIGRGTSTYDGVSIAWAMAEYLHDRYGEKGTKTLFATHYHELTDLARLKPRIHNYNVAVKEWNDEIIFLRTLAKGGMNRSYGIQVARLAGLPETVIQRAKEILHNLEQGELTETGVPTLSVSSKGREQRASAAQLELFATHPSPVEEAIRRATLDRMTPLEALNLLHRLQAELKKGEDT